MNNEITKHTEPPPQGYGPKKPEIIDMAQQASNNIHIEKSVHTVKKQDGCSYIDGVPMLKWGKHRDNTYCGAIAAAAEIMGIDVSYETLMGVSGLCFRIAMKPDWCPSSQLAQNGRVWDENINAVLGIAPYAIADENERRAKMIENLNQGIPVISMGMMSEPEWDLLTGYTEEGNIFFGRSYFDAQETEPDSPYCRAVNHYYTENKYRKAENYPGMEPQVFTKFMDTPCPKKPAAELLRNSLEICLYYYDCQPIYGTHFGKYAYDILINGLSVDDEEYKGFRRNEFYHIGSLADSHLCASVYLKDSASYVNNKAINEKLMKVSELYRNIYDTVTSVIAYDSTLAKAFNAGPEEMWDNDTRKNLIHVLTQAADTETKIQKLVKDILENWNK